MGQKSRQIRRRGGAARWASGGAAALALMALAALCGGCSLFRHESPQQQFMNALNRGNGAQASEIWLNMSAETRADLSHGQGMTPNLSPEEIQAKVLRREKEKAQAEGDDTESAMSDSDDGDITKEQIEMPLDEENPTDGNLSNLPYYNTPGHSEAPPESDPN